MRVLVASAHRLVGDALACVLTSEEDVEVVGVCHSGEGTLEEARRLRPDVIVMSAAFPDRGGAELIEEVRAVSEAGVLVMSNGSAEEFVWALNAGASGYLGPGCRSTELVEMVRKVRDGQVVVGGVERSAAFSGNGDGRGEPDPKRTAVLSTLTPREREVLSLLSRGFSNRRIAECLYVSEHTIRTHVQNLRSKLNVRSKFEAAVLAMHAAAAPWGTAGGFRL